MVMTRSASVVIAGLLFAAALPPAAEGAAPKAPAGHAVVVVAVPARAGAVDGTTQNSDEFIWRLFTEFTAPVSKSKPSPVLFETWASDEATFSNAPPGRSQDEPKKLHASALARTTTPHLIP